ncbi:MAG TPA: alpha/beta hydrolase [Myxococcota bacterium]|nr:alpha/beta hydrolase [Myxococcota bacterium]HND32510.1 alpha/beta hydrolase [Myxococcota bacterium]
MPLIFLHGSGLHAAFWDPLLAQVSRPDRGALSFPGRGGQPGPSPSDVAGLADAIGRLLPPNPVVVGHSLGGAVALELALTQPLAGLILINTGARLRVMPGIMDAMREAVESGIPAPVVGYSFQPETDPETVARTVAVEQEVPPESALADWQACMTFDCTADLGRISVPTLVCGGGRDLLTPPKYSEALAARIPGARLALLPEGGHMMPVEQVPWLLRQIEDFVAGLAAGKP